MQTAPLFIYTHNGDWSTSHTKPEPAGSSSSSGGGFSSGSSSGGGGGSSGSW